MHRQGRLAQAKTIYERIRAEQPKHFNALHLLGVIAHQTKNQELAIDLIDNAIQINPNVAGAFFIRGNVLKELERLDEALTSFDRAIALKPDFVDAFFSRGSVLQKLNRLEEALASYNRAIALKPDHADAYNNRGIALQALKRPAEALASYDQVIALNPDSADAFNNWGILLKELNRQEEALASFDQAIALEPDFADAFNNRGNVLKGLNRLDEALASYDQALALKPDSAETFFNRGNVLKDHRRLEEALASYDQALALKPGHADAFNNRGMALQALGRLEEALASFDQATALKPDAAVAFFNRGNLLQKLNRLDEALASYDRAIALKPNYADAFWNKSLLLILMGDYQRGWELYEWRLQKEDRPFPLKIWKGQNLPHHGLLVYMEQGMGDEIMFAWYMRYIAQRAAHVTVECDGRLVSLFQRSFPAFQVVARRNPVDPNTTRGNRRFKTAAGSVPKHFWFETRDHMMKMWPVATRPISRTTGYLKVDPGRREHWKRYLGSFGPERLKVGICWRSSYHSRARDLQYLAPDEIGQCFDENFVVLNLQYDHKVEETDLLAKVGRERGYEFVTPPEIDLKNDLDDLTALCEVCDIVVTPLISTAFMAGAVGTPTWVFRSSDTGRIWQQLGAPFVPWFPSMRLFFRHPTGPWSETIEKIRAALSEVLKMDGASYHAVIDVEPVVRAPDWVKN